MALRVENNVWVLSDNISTNTYSTKLKTKGTFLDKDIIINLVIPDETVLKDELIASDQKPSGYDNYEITATKGFNGDDLKFNIEVYQGSYS